MLNEGIFDMQKFVDGGWITGLRYEDEVMDDLKKRTGGKKDKLRSVSSHTHDFRHRPLLTAECSWVARLPLNLPGNHSMEITVLGNVVQHECSERTLCRFCTSAFCFSFPWL